MKTLAALVLLPMLAVAAETSPPSKAAAAPSGKAAARPASGIAAKVPPGVVSIRTARNLVAAGIKVVDLRSQAEFRAGHVHGAANIPAGEIEQRAAELGPPTTWLLVYCRSGSCTGPAAKALRSRGYGAVYELPSDDDWVKSEPRRRAPAKRQ